MVGGHWVDVADAAEELDVSPQRIRQLIANGSLGAERVSDRWAVSSETIEDYRHLSPPRGRPMSMARAWDELQSGPGAMAPDRLDRWRRRLRVRADWRRFRVHPAGLARLRADSRVVLSGRDAIADVAPVDPDEERVIGYVRDVDLADVVAAWGLESERVAWNVEVGVVDRDRWPFGDQRLAGPMAAWLDLLDHRDRAADVAAVVAFDAGVPDA